MTINSQQATNRILVIHLQTYNKIPIRVKNGCLEAQKGANILDSAGKVEEKKLKS